MKLLFVGAFALTASLSYAQVAEPIDSIAVQPVAQEEENVSLGETLIVGKGVIDLQDDRKTPIAATTIKKDVLETKVGAADITQAFVNTPSVYVAGQSGGFGESRIVTRGFDQSNTAFLFNGQPINGMDNGSLYWSNWSGMSDIASAVQIQRGLGSSKLAISSVGGTYNFVTKATDKKQGGFFSAGIANDHYYKSTIAYNSGLINNKFGVSVMLSHWQGNGYNDATKGEGQSYFISLGYKPARKHTLNFILTGGPQWHDQNSSNTISNLLQYGRKYNRNWGMLNGKEYNVRRNYYHKPVANLNWDWDISNKTSLSTVLYASWGRGGGSSSVTTGKSKTDPTAPFGILGNTGANGQLNLQEVYDRQSEQGGEALDRVISSINNHQWFGMVSNLNHKFNKNFSFNAGFDLRTYEGQHLRQANSFLGADYITEGADQQNSSYQVDRTFSQNPWKALNGFAQASEDRIGWYYKQRINYGGLFGQFEYTADKVTAFVQGSISQQSNQRIDYFNYTKGNEKSEKVENFGYNIKGGASYRISDNHQIFANAGYYSRQPYQNNIFMNYKNDVNPFAKNEEILGVEAGYKFKARNFWANLNAYYTTWENRITSTSQFVGEEGNSKYPGLYNQYVYTVNRGVKQEHKGLELEVNYKPVRQLTLSGFASVGNWEYKGNSLVTNYDEQQNVVGTPTSEKFDGLKVGDSAQTQLGAGLVYEIIKGLSVDADYRYNGDLYASRVNEENGNLKLPSYNIMDAGITWNTNLTERNKLTFRFNVNNVLNHIYIQEASTNYKADYKGADTYNGINVNNQIYFGYGRTWNASVRFTF